MSDCQCQKCTYTGPCKYVPCVHEPKDRSEPELCEITECCNCGKEFRRNVEWPPAEVAVINFFDNGRHTCTIPCRTWNTALKYLEERGYTAGTKVFTKTTPGQPFTIYDGTGPFTATLDAKRVTK